MAFAGIILACDFLYLSVSVRKTLANQALQDYCVANEVLLWAGNVKDAEAFQVSEQLGATAFPFIAVIAQLSGKMSMVARVEGPIEPSILIERLSSTVESLGAAIQSSRLEREDRERQRQLREEQDREYREALLADQEKVRRKRMNLSILITRSCFCRSEKSERQRKRRSARSRWPNARPVRPSSGPSRRKSCAG